MNMSLKDKVIFMSGGSRGIGLAIAMRAAKDGAKIAIAAKTTEPHPKLEGTIYTAARDIEQACLLYISSSSVDCSLKFWVRLCCFCCYSYFGSIFCSSHSNS